MYYIKLIKMNTYILLFYMILNLKSKIYSVTLKSKNLIKQITPPINDISKYVESVGNPNTITNINKIYIDNNYNFINNNNFEPTSDTDYFRYKPQVNDWGNKPNLISISPGGVFGFYTLGICAYIKNKYDLSNYIYSGASAGSWNSLYMVLNKENGFSSSLFSIDTINISSIIEMEYEIKSMLLKKYKTDDFDLSRLYIGVTVLKNKKLKTSIYGDFKDLKDAIDCCIASSHIPFITGGAINRYKDFITFDGGFSSYPYVRNVKPILHIHPNMWKNKITKNKYRNTLFNFKDNKYILKNLFDEGYEDAYLNSKYLDRIFTINT